MIGSSGIIFEICGVLIKFFSKSGLLGRKSAILFKFAVSGVLIKSGLVFTQIQYLFNVGLRDHQ